VRPLHALRACRFFIPKWSPSRVTLLLLLISLEYPWGKDPYRPHRRILSLTESTTLLHLLSAKLLCLSGSQLEAA